MSLALKAEPRQLFYGSILSYLPVACSLPLHCSETVALKEWEEKAADQQPLENELCSEEGISPGEGNEIPGD
jgi:hypothetical protein